MLEELEGREEKGRLDIWDWMGGVTSKGEVELQSKAAVRAAGREQVRRWSRNGEEGGRWLWSLENRTSCRETPAEGEVRGRAWRGKEQNRWDEEQKETGEVDSNKRE